VQGELQTKDVTAAGQTWPNQDRFRLIATVGICRLIVGERSKQASPYRVGLIKGGFTVIVWTAINDHPFLELHCSRIVDALDDR
jgi:hypothetical protein